MLRRSRWLWALLLTGAFALAVTDAGCADRTQLLISVSSEDYVIPDDIDRLDFSIVGQTSGMGLDRSFQLAAPWPHSLAIRPGMVESNAILVTITAYHGEDFVTRRVIAQSFASGIDNVVEVVLEGACRDVICEDGNDCQRGRCVGQIVDGGPPIIADASFDASIDGGVDANMDAPCPAGFTNCGGVCINPSENPMRCGADLACENYTTCVGNELCIEGACTLYCDPGLINCEGFCVDPQMSRDHCGAFGEHCEGGSVCPAGEYCALGSCSRNCPPGLYLCFGNCIDPQSDRHYCGAGSDCGGGVSCILGEQCSQGACLTACPGGLSACGGRCIDPMSDRLYCGASADCTGGTTCPSGQVCVSGTCGTSCPAPQISCGGRCVDPDSDEGYCGVASDCTGGAVCASGFICTSGVCVPNCPSGQVGCDGRCIDPLSDEQYCGASPTCTGAVVCGPRESCLSGVCGCEAPEESCGMGCVDTRFDPSNCGRCGRMCADGEACSGGACAPLSGGGFTGAFGTTWTTMAYREVNCIQEFIPRGSNDLYSGRGPEFGTYRLDMLSYMAETAPPYSIPTNCSLAYYGGGIFQVTSTDVTFFQPPSHEWRTAPLGMDLGPIGMTVTDLDSLWTANSNFLIRGSPATSTVETISVGVTMMAPRLTYDTLTARVYFAGQASTPIRSYDRVTRTLRVEGMAPGNVGAAFCGDRAGHIYVGSQSNPRQLWQFTPASGRWIDLPLLPTGVTGTTNCAVAEDGALYVAASPGTSLFKLSLTRI